MKEERQIRRLEQEIGREKMLLGIAIALDAGAIGWAARTALDDWWWIGATGSAVAGLTAVVLVLYSKINRLLERLERDKWNGLH